MDCPVCKNPMVVLEVEDIEVDHCFECGGIWLDAGELELLIDDPAQTVKLLNSFEADPNPTEKPRKCPICFKKMQKIIVGKENPVLLIDKCRKDDGLWFDKGELQDIISRAKLDRDNKIQKLLANIFGSEQQN